jgi:hypothetical protein
LYTAHVELGHLAHERIFLAHVAQQVPKALFLLKLLLDDGGNDQLRSLKFPAKSIQTFVSISSRCIRLFYLNGFPRRSAVPLQLQERAADLREQETFLSTKHWPASPKSVVPKFALKDPIHWRV